MGENRSLEKVYGHQNRAGSGEACAGEGMRGTGYLCMVGPRNTGCG